MKTPQPQRIACRYCGAIHRYHPRECQSCGMTWKPIAVGGYVVRRRPVEIKTVQQSLFAEAGRCQN